MMRIWEIDQGNTKLFHELLIKAIRIIRLANSQIYPPKTFVVHNLSFPTVIFIDLSILAN